MGVARGAAWRLVAGDTMESVFIAWSGNYDLACAVKVLLEKKGNRVEVGGGSPRGMYIGERVIEQMNSCTHAIILAQKRGEGDGSAKFSDNLMFEWGYLVSKLPRGRVTTYLIDTDFADIPSDLGGSWAESIASGGRPVEDVAADVVGLFKVERPRLDKIEVIASWQDVKRYLDEYMVRHSRSHSEMAQYVLFSVLSSFYNNEVDALDKKIGGITTSSAALTSIITMVRAMLRVYLSTSYMAKNLDLREYYEVVTVLEHEFEDDIDPEDADLKDWVRIIRLEHLQFCNYLMALATPDEADIYFHEEVVRLGRRAVELVAKNLEEHPENRYFAAIYLSFLHRNMAISFRVMGQEDKAIEQFNESVRQRGDFFFHYREKHREDVTVCDKVSQEYYLALLEQTEFEPDARKRRQIMWTVRAYMTEWEEQSGRRQSLFNMVRETYARVEDTFLRAGAGGGAR